MQHTEHYIIYFGSSRVVICRESPSLEYHTIEVDAMCRVSRAKVVKKVETYKYIALITPDPELTFMSLKEQFLLVEAAGGVVWNQTKELLMIHSRGHWDMPKGHVEQGESGRLAALREVEEETGIRCETVGESPVAHTWHAYDTYGRWELKRTVWWQMRAAKSATQAQAAEGITAAEWCPMSIVEEHLTQSYRTIKEVVAALSLKMKNCYE